MVYINFTRFFLILLMSLSTSLINYSLLAQNLVPNFSFEESTEKPTSMMDNGHEYADVSKYWKTPNLASTDLITPRFKTNKFEPIEAFSGYNMSGIVIHGDFWSEYLKVQLREPLKPGTEYYAEFWMAYCGDYNKEYTPRMTNSYLGAYFDQSFFKKNNEQLIKKPQVALKTQVELKDKTWVKISGSFIAKDTSNYIYIGQFANQEIPADMLLGYYYIDDVKVIKFSDHSTVFTPAEYAPDGLNNIYFETDKHDLLQGSFKTLDEVYGFLTKNLSLEISIIGHTDNRGEFHHNQELSMNRAQSVYDYLVNKGIAPERLKFSGKGASKPVASNLTEDGRQENRRVEFVASGELIKDVDLAQVNVTEADLSYRFANELNVNAKPYQYNFIGLYKDIFKCKLREKTGTTSSILKEHKPVAAVQYLDEVIKDQRLVFINDSPLHPQTRILTKELLQVFRDKGFTHLAIEAFTNAAEKVDKIGHPTINMGVYTDEPLFGELIREAIRLDFKIVSFNPSSVELDRAKKIVQKSMSLSPKDPKLTINSANWSKAMNLNRQYSKNKSAKYLVITHKNQTHKKEINGIRSIAYWFQQITQTAPYTIDQVTMNEQCATTEHPVYKFANVNYPAVLKKYTKIYNAPIGDVDGISDLQIFHPRSQFVQNRPTWLKQGDQKVSYQINADQYNMTYPLLVIAYSPDEDIEIAVPLDVIEISNSRDAMPLFLPPGTATLVLKDKKTRKKLDVEVN